MSKDLGAAAGMSRTEARSAASMAGIYALRMLGLFMILPVFALYAEELEGATPMLTGLATVVTWSDSIVLPTVSLLLGLNFISCLFAGLLGEAIIDTSGRVRRRTVGAREWRQAA